MAKEISRQFNYELGVVVVVIENALGVQTPHTICISSDRCPLCKRPTGQDGVADVQATIDSIIDEEMTRVDQALDKFASAGADVAPMIRMQSQMRTAIQQSRSVPTDNP